jgi:D-xylose transport system permease protein
VPLSGIPFCVPIMLGVLILWKFVPARTLFGRYVYAIGGNAEAARRVGVRLGAIRLAAFGLTGLTAGIAGILYTSRLGGSCRLTVASWFCWRWRRPSSTG